MVRELSYYIVVFLVFLILQLFIFNQIEFFEYGYCFVYLGFLLMLPYDLDKVLGLIIGFVIGLLFDISYQTGGIHTAASVFVMFIRPGLLALLNPKSGFELGMKLTVSQMGWIWYLIYGGILIFLHHLIIFNLNAFDFSYFFKSLMLASFSALISFSMIITVQALFFNRVRA